MHEDCLQFAFEEVQSSHKAREGLQGGGLGRSVFVDELSVEVNEWVDQERPSVFDYEDCPPGDLGTCGAWIITLLHLLEDLWHTEVFDLYGAPVLQPGAVNGDVLVIGDGFAIFRFRDAQTVDGEAGLCRYPLVQVAAAPLEVDARLRGQLGYFLSWSCDELCHAPTKWKSNLPLG